MRNFRKWGVIGLVLIVALAAMGCNTVIPTNQGTIDQIHTPLAKDFTSLGLVFSEGVYKSTADGNIFTYYDLLKQAQELGADAIVNVTIDKKSVGTKFLIFDLGSTTNWFGSALAIKYTGSIATASENVVTNTNVSESGVISTTTTTATSNGFILNSGADSAVDAGVSTAKKKTFWNLWGLLKDETSSYQWLTKLPGGGLRHRVFCCSRASPGWFTVWRKKCIVAPDTLKQEEEDCG
jgi:hypothetical protein